MMSRVASSFSMANSTARSVAATNRSITSDFSSSVSSLTT